MANMARLRDLNKDATQGPWYRSTSANVPRNQHGDIQWPDHLRSLSIHWDHHMQDADAELVIEMRNAFSAMLEIVDVARALTSAWDEPTRTQARAVLNAAYQKLEEA